jgi:uncharacterized membrane protein YfcA
MTHINNLLIPLFFLFVMVAALNIIFTSDRFKNVRSVTVERPKYGEKPLILKDGTPCTIILGGMYSGMVGVTCNYSATKESE